MRDSIRVAEPREAPWQIWIVDPAEATMALLQASPGQKTATYQDLGRVLLFVAAAIVLMLVATAILGVQVPGPSYDIVPDPAGLGIPF